ncbi:MAG: hypothetical protein P1P90_04925 [Patescibacteria group bacterium]|nr:hypothetical protein [Patescibacteria group bacterium]
MSVQHLSQKSDRVVSLKAVVTETGYVVAKDYDRRRLQKGDIGLELRIDRGKLREMTGDQQVAVRALAPEMAREWQNQLGIQVEEEVLTPGMEVRYKSVVSGKTDVGLAIVRSVKSPMVSLDCLHSDGVLRRKVVPLAAYIFEELSNPFTGVESLVIALVHYAPEQVTKEKATCLKSEAAQDELIFATEVHDYVKIHLIMSRDFSEDRCIALLKKLYPPKGFVRRSSHAVHMVLLDRVQTEAGLLRMALEFEPIETANIRQPIDEAASRMKNEHSLAQLAMRTDVDWSHSPVGDLRVDAVKKISNNELLTQIAQKYADTERKDEVELCLLAVYLISDFTLKVELWRECVRVIRNSDNCRRVKDYTIRDFWHRMLAESSNSEERQILRDAYSDMGLVQ